MPSGYVCPDCVAEHGWRAGRLACGFCQAMLCATHAPKHQARCFSRVLDEKILAMGTSVLRAMKQHVIPEWVAEDDGEGNWSVKATDGSFYSAESEGYFTREVATLMAAAPKLLSAAMDARLHLEFYNDEGETALAALEAAIAAASVK